MADTIKLRAGVSGSAPDLADRELAYYTDEKRLVVGTDSGNVPMPSMADINGKLTAKRMITRANLNPDASLLAVITAFNQLMDDLKNNGFMNNG